jgi:hypothetical protein
MRPPRLPRLALLAALLACGAPFSPEVLAGESVFRRDYPGVPDTFVEIEAVFGIVANQGSLPYRITIRNHSGRNRVWTVRFVEGNSGRPLSTRATWRIEVEDGAEVRREVTFAFAPNHLAYNYRNLQVEVSASGLGSETRHVGAQAPTGFPLLAISNDLALRNLGRLDDLVKGRHSGDSSFAKRFDPAHLPGEWLGYTGLDGLLLDERAWNGLSAVQRQGLLAWVHLGGQLHLFGKDTAKIAQHGIDLQAPRGQLPIHPLGLGEVRLWTWDGQDLPEKIVDAFRSLPIRSASLEGDYAKKWGLHAGLGVREFNTAPLFFLLVAFAILVGPVNLFYFARPGQRHRLFLTTPAISVATCALLSLAILLVDGLGGKGRRVVLADLHGVENRLYTTQEQVSRTGLVATSGFAPGRTYDLNPVKAASSRFDPFSREATRPATFEMGAGRYLGEFFRSRSEQAYLLRSAEPSRARIELAGLEDGVPVLVSNLPQEILALRYRDDRGTLWDTTPGTPIGPGGRVPLAKAEKNAQPDWMSETAALFGGEIGKRFAGLVNDRNRFFAQVRDPDAFALPTHPGIRWEETALLLTGTPSGPASTSEVGEAAPQSPDAKP